MCLSLDAILEQPNRITSRRRFTSTVPVPDPIALAVRHRIGNPLLVGVRLIEQQLQAAAVSSARQWSDGETRGQSVLCTVLENSLEKQPGQLYLWDSWVNQEVKEIWGLCGDKEALGVV